jgi:hypothetical protein
VQKLDALLDIERAANGKSAAERLAMRQELSVPLIAELHIWLTAQLASLLRNHDLAKAINYMLRRWDAFTRFLGDGRVCITNNAAERALRGIPLGRKSWLFCGSDRGGQRAAVMYKRRSIPRSARPTIALKMLICDAHDTSPTSMFCRTLEHCVRASIHRHGHDRATR